MQDTSHEHREAASYEPSSAEEGKAPTCYDSPVLLQSDKCVFKKLTKTSRISQELHSVIFYRSMNPWIDRVYSHDFVGAYALDRWIHTIGFVRICIIHQLCSSFLTVLENYGIFLITFANKISCASSTVSMLERKERQTGKISSSPFKTSPQTGWIQ